ncbi:hypothetical protein evm_004656 [Chilo suppressalis]|nr:hypothetical protein evm_004656 [Chilo suppressalis]
MVAGISTLSGCGSPDAVDRLPELPAAEERRLRRAAHVLQQRLVLRQWLATHRLQHAYSKLLSLDVSSLEDVYWLEDSAARHVLESKDFGAWSAARQSLPTGKEALQTLKADLWSAVVKNSKHQDAWTWGGMLVVSVSVCGLVTLAAMTQPALAPEAKHSLLQYVTGKYLHPPSCRRNGQPYPICDTDELTAVISLGTRKPINVPTAGAQTFPMQGLGHAPPRGTSADWQVLTTAYAAGTNCLTCLGQPYPICDTDELTAVISLGTRKAFPMDRIGRLGYAPSRGTSADWRVLLHMQLGPTA